MKCDICNREEIIYKITKREERLCENCFKEREVKQIIVRGTKEDVLKIIERLKEKYGNITILELIDKFKTDKLELN